MPLALLVAAVLYAPAAAPARAEAAAIAAPATVAQSPWYYSVEGRAMGPIDDAAFIDAYLAGRITDATLVWWDGATEWTTLAQAARFAELDRWYARFDSRETGPMRAEELRAKIAIRRAEGHAVESLEVRLERSQWLPLSAVHPLLHASFHRSEPPAAPVPARAPAPAAIPTSEPAPEPSDDDVERDNGRAIATLTPHLGLALPGTATPAEITKTKVGVGGAFQLEAMFAPADHFEIGSYLHYSVRGIKERGTGSTEGELMHLASGGLMAKIRFPVSARSRMRIGAGLGYNRVRQRFENDIARGWIVGEGVNLSPSIEWSVDIAPRTAFNLQLAAITQVWGQADLGDLGAVVDNGRTQTFSFPPLAYLAFGFDFCFGQRRQR